MWEALGTVRDLGRLQEIASVLIRYGFGDIVRRDPLRFVLIVLAIVFLLGLMAAPGYLLSR